MCLNILLSLFTLDWACLQVIAYNQAFSENNLDFYEYCIMTERELQTVLAFEKNSFGKVIYNMSTMYRETNAMNAY